MHITCWHWLGGELMEHAYQNDNTPWFGKSKDGKYFFGGNLLELVNHYDIMLIQRDLENFLWIDDKGRKFRQR